MTSRQEIVRDVPAELIPARHTTALNQLKNFFASAARKLAGTPRQVGVASGALTPFRGSRPGIPGLPGRAQNQQIPNSKFQKSKLETRNSKLQPPKARFLHLLPSFPALTFVIRNTDAGWYSVAKVRAMPRSSP